jgi:hypothetical protein
VFEQLFERPHALARQRNGPLAEERCRYLVHCASQQLARRTLRCIAIYILIVAKALRLADRPGMAGACVADDHERVRGSGSGDEGESTGEL